MKEFQLFCYDSNDTAVVLKAHGKNKRISLRGTKRKQRKIVVFFGGIEIAEIEWVKSWNTGYAVSVFKTSDHLRGEHLGTYKTVFLAQRAIKDWIIKNSENVQQRVCPPKYLPSADNTEFFPTPSSVAGQMFRKINWKVVNSVLEPSAGKGDLADFFLLFADHNNSISRRHSDMKSDVIDTIEMDPNLQFILRGKGYHLVADNFLSFSTHKHYDAIIMNPPFSNGDEHLLHAIQLMRDGGQICCLLNAETIRNPYTQRRKVLRQKLAELNANISFVKNAFSRAERPTDIEIAIVYLNIPKVAQSSRIWESLKKAAELHEESNEPNAIAERDDWVHQLIRSYDMEANAGVSLIREYAGITPYIMTGSDVYDRAMISLEIDGHAFDGSDYISAINRFMKRVRTKYWHLLLFSDKLESVTGAMPSALRGEYQNSVERMQDYDFSEYNIRQVILDIQIKITQGIDKAILDLFNELSAEHAWYPECQKNIHYYNGWKTNKAHKVGNKCIIPVNGCYAESWKHELLDTYRVSAVLSDLEKVMNYLDKGKTEFHNNLSLSIGYANRVNKAIVDCTYFYAQFYKKGTCHIKFKPEAQHILDRLNIYAARKYGWLPPYYGKVSYKDMDEEGKTVIDEFQGADEYAKVVSDPSEFILEASSFAKLSA